MWWVAGAWCFKVRIARHLELLAWVANNVAQALKRSTALQTMTVDYLFKQM